MKEFGVVPKERLLDCADIAERMSVSERTVRALVARGELPGPLLHTGGIARWDWGVVLKFLQARSEKRIRKGRGRYRRAAEVPLACER